jgi:hypothetical protein
MGNRVNGREVDKETTSLGQRSVNSRGEWNRNAWMTRPTI